MHKENQVIVLNIFLHGPLDSGRNTFLQWLVQNENLLDANFLKSIEYEQKQLRAQINRYMRALKELPRTIKQNLDKLIQEQKFEEANTYFEISSYRIQELCRAYDGELNRYTKKSIKKLQDSRLKTIGRDQTFSSIDIVGSIPNMIYRIHYNIGPPPNQIELNTFLSTIDGLIFIWNVQSGIKENINVFEELLNNLPPNARVPLVIALNKVDLPHTITSADVRHLLTQARYEEKLRTTLLPDTLSQELTIFETVGTQGISIKNVIRSVVRIIVAKNRSQIQELTNLLYQEVQR